LLRAQQLRTGGQEQQLNALKMDQYRREVAAQETMRNALANGASWENIARQTGDLSMVKDVSAIRANEARAGASDATRKKEMLNESLAVFEHFVNDDASKMQFVAKYGQVFPEIKGLASMPFSQEMKQAMLLKAKDELAADRGERELALSARRAGAAETRAAATQDLARTAQQTRIDQFHERYDPDAIKARQRSELEAKVEIDREKNLPKLRLANESFKSRMSSLGIGVDPKTLKPGDPPPTIVEAKKLARDGWFTTGVGAAATGVLPSTSARRLGGLIDTINANVGRDTLQEIRAAAVNGSSGYGQLVLKELERLESTITKLDQWQTDEQVLTGIAQIEKHYLALQERLAEFTEAEEKLVAGESEVPSGDLSAEEQAELNALEAELGSKQ
jgi:hypothetical protein